MNVFENFLKYQTEILSVGPVKYIFPVTAVFMVCMSLYASKLTLMNIWRGFTQ